MNEPTLAGAQVPDTTSRSPFTLLGAVAPLVGLVVAILFLANTQWYGVFKTIHVLAAILWLGGGFTITLLALQAQRAKDNAALAQVAKHAEWLAMRLFVPASLVVFAFGLLLVHKGSWGYAHFWTIFALAAWATSFVVGAGFLGPESGKLAKLLETKGPDDPETLARINRIIAVARADVVLILLIAADMVAKPFS
jgi:uncharacterized membrane protein